VTEQGVDISVHCTVFWLHVLRAVALEALEVLGVELQV
jgi:hypothetical protein